MGKDGNFNKKDKRKYYNKKHNVNNKRKEQLDDLIFGVMITADKNKEKSAVRDAFNILNDAVEHLYPDLHIKKEDDKLNTSYNKIMEENPNPNNIENSLNDDLIKSTKKQKLSENEQNTTKTTNISDLLENELKNLRNNKAKIFFNFDTSCKGVVFVKIDRKYKNEIDIKKIVKYIINNIKETKEQISKNIARFIPVEIAMKAKFLNFSKNAHLALDKYFKNTNDIENSENKDNVYKLKKTWKTEIKVRNNHSINKDEYLNFMIDYVDRDKFVVDYKNPDLTVLIEITHDLLCLSILEDYIENKSYNLLTLSKSDEELKSERDKLMSIQKKREEEKKLLEKNKKSVRKISIEENKNIENNLENAPINSEIKIEENNDNNIMEDQKEISDAENDVDLI